MFCYNGRIAVRMTDISNVHGQLYYCEVIIAKHSKMLMVFSLLFCNVGRDSDKDHKLIEISHRKKTINLIILLLSR